MLKGIDVRPVIEISGCFRNWRPLRRETAWDMIGDVDDDETSHERLFQRQVLLPSMNLSYSVV